VREGQECWYWDNTGFNRVAGSNEINRVAGRNTPSVGTCGKRITHLKEGWRREKSPPQLSTPGGPREILEIPDLLGVTFQRVPVTWTQISPGFY